MNRWKSANRRALGAAAVTTALLVPLGVFGAPALARNAASSSSQYQYKITICHKTHSQKHPWVQIKVAAAAWKGHSKHDGDFLVTANAPCPPAAAGTAAPPTHGKSGQPHGNSGNNGNDNGKGHGK